MLLTLLFNMMINFKILYLYWVIGHQFWPDKIVNLLHTFHSYTGVDFM